MLRLLGCSLILFRLFHRSSYLWRIYKQTRSGCSFPETSRILSALLLYIDSYLFPGKLTVLPPSLKLLPRIADRKRTAFLLSCTSRSCLWVQIAYLLSELQEETLAIPPPLECIWLVLFLSTLRKGLAGVYHSRK